MAKYKTLLSMALMMFVFGFVLYGCSFANDTYEYESPSDSMSPTIKAGDTVMVEPVKSSQKIQIGDILALTDPEVDGRILIKRCIAKESQTISIDETGDVYVDGEKFYEPYLDCQKTYPLDFVDIEYPYLLLDGYIWVMGDNRMNSQDSRYFGAVPIDSVFGKVIEVKERTLEDYGMKPSSS